MKHFTNWLLSNVNNLSCANVNCSDNYFTTETKVCFPASNPEKVRLLIAHCNIFFYDINFTGSVLQQWVHSLLWKSFFVFFKDLSNVKLSSQKNKTLNVFFEECWQKENNFIFKVRFWRFNFTCCFINRRES